MTLTTKKPRKKSPKLPEEEKDLGGRPNEFKEEYIEKADEYLATCKDVNIQVVKQSNSEKGYEMYEQKLKVNLPTIEGFSIFLNVSVKSLYNWSDDNPRFLQALENIKKEQKKRIMEEGLAGNYNPTIAKLILSSNHGMNEKSETELSGSFTLADLLGRGDLDKSEKR